MILARDFRERWTLPLQFELYNAQDVSASQPFSLFMGNMPSFSNYFSSQLPN